MTIATATPQQPSLFDRDELPGLREPLYAPDWTIQERFEAFHQANPHVYQRLRELALDLTAHGHRRIGIGMLFEVLRWQAMIVTEGDDYRLNNNHRSRYARMLAAQEPALADVFETRELKA